MRLRTLPVLGTMPAIVGMSCAAYVMTQLGGKPFEPRKIESVSQKFAHKLQNRLVQHEAKVRRHGHDMDIWRPAWSMPVYLHPSCLS
jgi:hypothetical protein